ncbi:hypothetical protein [Niastella sp. OAS944]|uniref:hypothetical protein n=1 Tax=Niastella sp. OAS944 TaxID=2664089 RepID=UPI0034775696|nr:hypothetical protein [Chitinophagaceae bacterium OAS944]
MDLKNFVPGFLSEDRFRDQAFTLTSFLTEGHIYQTFTGKSLFSTIEYNADGSIRRAVVGTLADGQDDLKENEYFGPFLRYRPSILDNADFKNEQWVFKDLFENLTEQWIQQRWTSDNYYVDVQFDANFTILLEKVVSSEFAQLDYKTFYRSGKPEYHYRQLDSYSKNMKRYYESGDLNWDKNETQQNLLVGKITVYKEDGTLQGEYDYEKSPYHPIGYLKAREIAKENGLIDDKMTLVLRWIVKDGNSELEIDAVNGAPIVVKKPIIEEEPSPDIEPAYLRQGFQNILEDHIAKENIIIMDAEGFEEVRYYGGFLEDMIGLTNGLLTLQNASFKEGDPRSATVTINNVTREFSIRCINDWFDNDFITNINLLLESLGSKHLFYMFYDPSFGQELGVVFLKKTMAAYFNYLIRQRNDDSWGGLYDPFGKVQEQ